MMARLDQEMEKSGFGTLESIHRRKDGSTFPVEINVKMVRLERNYRLAVVRDITERKRNVAHISVLAREAEHRAKNILSTVQAVVKLTEAETVADFTPEARSTALSMSWTAGWPGWHVTTPSAASARCSSRKSAVPRPNNARVGPEELRQERAIGFGRRAGN